ncbi:MAG: hypothetical protein GY799_24775, partial [Desulfobulbaceae bacterium]|nr:hypothetical protein [Desulfobulbaceae bacterium]
MAKICVILTGYTLKNCKCLDLLYIFMYLFLGGRNDDQGPFFTNSPETHEAKRGTPEGHTNLTRTYGLLETIAGTGLTTADKQDNWRPEFEGGPATSAALSRP